MRCDALNVDPDSTPCGGSHHDVLAVGDAHEERKRCIGDDGASSLLNIDHELASIHADDLRGERSHEKPTDNGMATLRVPVHLRRNSYLSFGQPKAQLVEFERPQRSEEHTSELQSHVNLVCRLLLEKKK